MRSCLIPVIWLLLGPLVAGAMSLLGPPAAARERIGGWQTVVIDERPIAGRLVAWPIRIRQTRHATVASLHGGVPTGSGGIGATDGIASYYWQEQGTSSGERFDRRALTAAHRTLPFGTRVRVTHVTSGRQVVVRINDRGPFKPGRIIDLSEAAADHLGMRGSGLARVRIEVVN